ncbi:MAG: diheme cytochrome c [Tildeniella nuda ZEHNDER 1965/U140]|nr:diheme cytochrome c [Tildeniella nuda ZEHNDER 1965/U140]
MPHPVRQRSRDALLRLTDRWHLRKRGRSLIVLLLLLLTWSLCLGWGLAQAKEPRAIAPVAQPLPASTAVQPIGTVDAIPKGFKLGQDIYLENCASCHIGIPTQVMPTETWRQLIQDSQHYGVQIQPLVAPNLQIVWQYIRTFSRPQSADEDIPYRVYQSRYFKALHPKVKLPTRAGLSSCLSCHPGADKYDFRSLTAEWQNAP